MSTHRIRNSLLAVVVAATLSACGGDGYSQSSRNPQIQGLTDQSVSQDTTVGPLPFSISDTDSDPGSVVVTATSSDTSIIPSDNIVLAGTGASRTLQLTPASDAIGTVTVTLSAVDPVGRTGTATIQVQINGVYASFLNTALTSFATDENGDQSQVSGLTFTPDADDNETAFDALLQ